MRILVFSHYFWPEDFRINDLLHELSLKGHTIEVITGKPNYPEGNIFEDFKDAPENFQNYENIKITRLNILPRGNNLVSQFLNYLSYVFKTSIFVATNYKKFNLDLIFVYMPSPITVCIPAILLKFLVRKPMIYWVLDLWPETLRAIGLITWKINLFLLSKIINFFYNRADLILGSSHSFVKSITSRSSTPVNFFPNWAEKIFEEYEFIEYEPNSEDTFSILFAGNIGISQDLEKVVDAFSMAKKNNSSLKLKIVGEGRNLQSVKKKVKELKLEKSVIFYGRKPISQMPKIYEEADALIISLKNDETMSKTIPGKLPSCLIAKKPILTMASGEVSEIVDSSGSGLTAMSGEVDDLARNMVSISNKKIEELKKIGLNGHTFYNENFKRKKLINFFEKTILKIV